MANQSDDFKSINEFIKYYEKMTPRTFEEINKNSSDKNDEFYIVLEIATNILSSISDKPDRWIISCPIYFEGNYPFIVKQCKIMTHAEKILNDNKWRADLENLFINCIELYYEFDFNDKESFLEKTLPNEDILNKIHFLAYSESFTSNFRDRMRNMANSVAYVSMKRLFHCEQINKFMDFDEKNESARSTLEKIDSSAEIIAEKINQFKNELNDKEQTVNSLKETLDKQETAFNFVGLYDGFNQLLRTKIKESRVLLGLLAVMSCMMIIPLLCTIFGWLPENILKAEEPISHLLKLVPFISLEILLIYFFRVILQNYKSVKGQILQIELRQTLCQFIQNYAEYSKEIRTNDSHPLEKFENLIFSGIISDAENLPSTFDGMDQIGKLFSTLKGKG